MCHKACMDFFTDECGDHDFKGKKIIEVGSYDVNGSLRNWVRRSTPRSYLGVDISSGPGVDQVCPVGKLTTTFGKASFDVAISTEMLEHVEDWREAITNLKDIIHEGGLLILTTRSPGFAYHGYPHDFWRYDIEDFKTIFSDMEILSLKQDPEAPGVFIKARKTSSPPARLDKIALYSIRSGSRSLDIPKLSARIRISLWFKAIFCPILRKLLPLSVQGKLNALYMRWFLN